MHWVVRAAVVRLWCEARRPILCTGARETHSEHRAHINQTHNECLRCAFNASLHHHHRRHCSHHCRCHYWTFCLELKTHIIKLLASITLQWNVFALPIGCFTVFHFVLRKNANDWLSDLSDVGSFALNFLSRASHISGKSTLTLAQKRRWRTSATIYMTDDRHAFCLLTAARPSSTHSIESNIHDTEQIVVMDKILK